ncbi:hypothetical protein CPB97_008369 [Podila verticillata]|nr:hypothetical protein CPB97_008369 [Podila verticillata]
MHQTIDYIDQLTFPPQGHVTIGEANSSLVHISGQEDPKQRAFINTYGAQRDALQVPSRNTPLPEPPVLKAPREQETGFLGATQIPPKSWTIDTVKDRIPAWVPIDTIEKQIRQLGMDKYFQSVESAWNTAQDIWNDIREIEDLGDKLAHLLIRTIAFHPLHPVLAIALWDNSVWIYDLSHKAWHASPLAHKTYQSRVMTLQWKPMSGTILTVGCEAGVSVWHVYRGKYIQDPFSGQDNAPALSQEKSSTSPNFGKDPIWDGVSRFGCLGVDQMAWDPRGELLAVSSSARSSTVYIRDGATNQIAELTGTLPHVSRSKTSPVKVSILTNKVCVLAWSPSGEHLVVGYQSGLMRVFSTATWEAVDISDLGGAVQSACWTPDGYNLIYTLVDDHVIRALHFEKRGGELNWIKLNYVTMSLQEKDIRRYQNEGESPAKAELRRRLGGVELEDLRAFGPVEQVILDPNGERLVVRFRNTDLLGVVLVRPTGTPLRDLDIFMPLGFIRGPASRQTHQGQSLGGEVAFRDPKVVAMSFASRFESGSLLSLAWESGAITFTPFYYLSQQRIDTRL